MRTAARQGLMLFVLAGVVGFGSLVVSRAGWIDALRARWPLTAEDEADVAACRPLRPEGFRRFVRQDRAHGCRWEALVPARPWGPELGRWLRAEARDISAPAARRARSAVALHLAEEPVPGGGLALALRGADEAARDTLLRQPLRETDPPPVRLAKALDAWVREDRRPEDAPTPWVVRWAAAPPPTLDGMAWWPRAVPNAGPIGPRGGRAAHRDRATLRLQEAVARLCGGGAVAGLPAAGTDAAVGCARAWGAWWRHLGAMAVGLDDPTTPPPRPGPPPVAGWSALGASAWADHPELVDAAARTLARWRSVLQDEGPRRRPAEDLRGWLVAPPDGTVPAVSDPLAVLHGTPARGWTGAWLATLLLDDVEVRSVGDVVEVDADGIRWTVDACGRPVGALPPEAARVPPEAVAERAMQAFAASGAPGASAVAAAVPPRDPCAP